MRAPGSPPVARLVWTSSGRAGSAQPGARFIGDAEVTIGGPGCSAVASTVGSFVRSGCARGMPTAVAVAVELTADERPPGAPGRRISLRQPDRLGCPPSAVPTCHVRTPVSRLVDCRARRTSVTRRMTARVHPAIAEKAGIHLGEPAGPKPPKFASSSSPPDLASQGAAAIEVDTASGGHSHRGMSGSP